MSEISNNAGKKNTAQCYDSRIDEKCVKCSGDLVYRKHAYFGNKVYYKVCNKCGWYMILEKEAWKEIVTKALALPAKASPAEIQEQEDQLELITD